MQNRKRLDIVRARPPATPPPTPPPARYVPVVDLDSLGGRVATLLTSRNMSLNQLDRTLEQGSGYTSRLVSGEKKHPHPESLQKIADFFQVRLEWLISGRSPMHDVQRAEDVYPWRARVALAARLRSYKFDEEAIVSMEEISLPDDTPDPGGQFWEDELDRIAERQSGIAKARARAAENMKLNTRSPKSYLATTPPTSPPRSVKR